MHRRFWFCLFAAAASSAVAIADEPNGSDKSTSPRENKVTQRVSELEKTASKLKLAKNQAASQSAAGNGALQQRVNDLEQTVKQLLEEVGQLKQQVQQAAAQPTASSKALNPDISLIVDTTGRLFRGDRTLRGVHPDINQFTLREGELALQSVIDPFGRMDAFISVGPEGVELEEAYATITNAKVLGLPKSLQLRIGRMHPAFGKINLTHRPETKMIDYPMPLTNFLGDDGFKSNGVEVSYLFPFRTFTEFKGGVFNADNPVSFAGTSFRRVLGIGQLRTFLDLSESSNLDLGMSLANGSNNSGRTTNLANVHAVYRWKPARRGQYDSFTWWNEFFFSDRGDRVDDGTGTGTLVGTRYKRNGFFTMLEKQLDRGLYVGALYERSQFPALVGREQALSAFATMFPSEFSKYRIGLRRKQHAEGLWSNEFFFQTTFNIGAHGAHPF